MKVLFVGPSLFGTSIENLVGFDEVRTITRCGPARHGDLIHATLGGATAIGLVDGLFETTASVWHKEILFALSEGVHVLGAASMGALRAAECAPFGMIGVGAIYRRYASGDLDDDAAVAQLHAPAELGCAPLTEALVNVEATIAGARRSGRLTARCARALMTSARRLHFRDRSWHRIIETIEDLDQHRQALDGHLSDCCIDLKARDAAALVAALAAAPTTRASKPAFSLSYTHMLEQTLRTAYRRAPLTG